ncbi:MAG: Uma2 family endonuclease [Candidatus Sumerlaeaceae bacterium]
MSAVPEPRLGFTFADYENWPADVRVELINGQIFDMSPAPTPEHQRILGELHVQIHAALKGKECKVYLASFDVRLAENNERDQFITSVVQPDISVVCDAKKLDDKGCRGAPDFIIEILSPHTSYKDQMHKVRLYERHRVREYWTIHPDDKVLTIRLLNESGKYGEPAIKPLLGRVDITVLPGVSIDFDEFISWGPFYVMEHGPDWYIPYGGVEKVRRGFETNVIKDNAVRV